MNQIERTNLSKLKKCNQLWDQMEPNDCGRLCTKCDKTIHDFRGMSDREVAVKHAFSTEILCGIYDKQQLRLPKRPKQGVPRLNVKALYVSLASLLLSEVVTAQNQPIKTEQSHPDSSQMARRPIETNPIKEQAVNSDSLIYFGQIKADNGEALPYVTVFIQGTKIGVNSDFDGKYRIDLAQQFDSARTAKLVFSCIGYATQVIMLEQGRNKHLDVTMTESRIVAFGVPATFPKHRSFWAWISSPFRGWKKRN